MSETPETSTEEPATKAPAEEPVVEAPVKPSRTRVSILAALVVLLILSNGYTFMTLNDQVNTLTADKTSLQAQMTDLTEIVNLNKITTIVNNQTMGQAAGTYTSWPVSTQYAGYLKVIVHTSTSSNTYVQVTYNAYSVIYDETITVGAGGTAVFPLLPAENIEVRVGNTNPTNSATERITVTYHY
jgi:hypothetical protein